MLGPRDSTVVVIEKIVPGGVVVSERRGDPCGPALFAAEQELVARAVERRRREFIGGRRCAHDALARLRMRQGPILAGRGGEPLWPDDVVGSITHCVGYRAAAVARCTEFTAIGIDAESHAPLPDGVADAIALPEERSQLARLRTQAPGLCWDRILFSTKESTYKAWYPAARRMLAFDQAEITLDSSGTFRVQLLVPGPIIGVKRLRVLSGRWSVDEGLILSAVTVPAHSSDY